ncbi:glutamine--tRNA ligase/YqeY domain fusion protein [Bradyrhizobium sp. LHD-71]|uniref:glutamine--tRNA ligase/YqeY domain fusion protein n=1 Tax=Bradyrhizobium sp. LHD-71 TaxID=3072141 RepID=UPI00280CE3BB|nr:glutamine--tRNA ligase/YqeY domain fusion protein [Bradyrhizobium sp. LHD-71]MDQ8727551.1 glutamine--tRNA ligase/YqeY domain fusion protein [Bradyrhizobium sp. LHD-71]
MAQQSGVQEVNASANNFIRSIIASDVDAGCTRVVITRFPPEPNGYLHLGHAKSIVLNYELAKEFGGRCNLRLDDTNPAKEKVQYIDAIKRDVQWLGFEWAEGLRFASDYFEQLYAWACHLIHIGKAYVDDQSVHDIREGRGTLTSPGRNSPFRARSVEENAELFARMRAGEFRNGERVLRAKIDMASPNLNLRDPVIYRILNASHPRTGTAWHIYPSYDFAHGQCDAIEEVSHSLCTLEFEDHRPLYDWFLDNLPVPSRPRQFEFARLDMTHTVLSKRVLTELVRDGHVEGWDDPRMPTLAGLRRRGVPAEAVRRFIRGVGVSKANSTVDDSVLDAAIRDVLNEQAPRRMAVLKPLKVTIENYPAGRIEELEAPNHPADASFGTRIVPFSREVYIEQDDFSEVPPRGFRRLAPGREVRLRYGYLVTCHDVVKDAAGRVVELRCTYDPDSGSGAGGGQRKVGATIHWVSAVDALPAEVRLFNRLFTRARPTDLVTDLDPHSMQTLSGCLVERATASDPHGDALQFERQGYFTHDDDSRSGRLVFNRTASLRENPGKSPAAHLDRVRK